MSKTQNGSQVELIYDRDCPNVNQTRAAIRAALTEVGDPGSWTEWDRESPKTPLPLRGYGSPTVLVRGNDVAGADIVSVQSDANSCRIYADEAGQRSGAPSAELIVTALRAASER